MPLPRFTPPTGLAIGGCFREALAEGELALPRCTSCGTWEWYPHEMGPHCADGEREWARLPGTGTVFTFTTVRRPFLPDNSWDDVPYVVILVEPDGAEGVRLVGNLADGNDPVIGMRVQLDSRSAPGEGSPTFRPLDEVA
jgi:uncharacterized protein